MIRIVLPNIPVPWAAPKLSKRGLFDPRSKEKEFTRWQIKSQYRGETLKGYYRIFIRCIFPMPNSASEKTKQLMREGKIAPTGCDNTNLQKLYEDCLKKIVIEDDRNVVDIQTKKFYGERERVIIEIFPVETLEFYVEGV